MIASFLGSPWPPPLYFVCAIFLREIIVHKQQITDTPPPSRAHAHETTFIARSLHGALALCQKFDSEDH